MTETTAATEIREASVDDRSAIKRIAEEVVNDGTVFVFEDPAEVVDFWHQPGGRVFVALQDDKVLGTYVIKPNQPGRGAHVANAGYMVSQAARGLGIGTALGEHSIQIAQELGFDAMQFNMVVATNTGAIHLWEKLGFEAVGRLPRVFRHSEHGPVDALVMYRSL